MLTLVEQKDVWLAFRTLRSFHCLLAPLWLRAWAVSSGVEYTAKRNCRFCKLAGGLRKKMTSKLGLGNICATQVIRIIELSPGCIIFVKSIKTFYFVFESLCLIKCLFYWKGFLFPFPLNLILPLSNPLFNPIFLCITLPHLSVACLTFRLSHLVFFICYFTWGSLLTHQALAATCCMCEWPVMFLHLLLFALLYSPTFLLPFRYNHLHTTGGQYTPDAWECHKTVYCWVSPQSISSWPVFCSNGQYVFLFQHLI